MSPLMQDIVAFLAVANTLLSVPAVVAQNADGVSPYGTGHAPDVISIDTAWNNYYPSFEGSTIPDLNDSLDYTTDPTPDLGRRAAKNFYLRVMPLGASITEGAISSDGNGYRKWLRSQLRWKGWKVNMVGSKQNGNMADKDNEGHGGWVIAEIHTAFKNYKWMMPNLVLINAGTNDCGQNIDIVNAGQRLKAMIDDIFNSVPGVTVIVSTLVLSRDNPICAARVSQQYRNLVVDSYRNARIGIADIHKAMSASDLSSDGVHPNDKGYKLFAAVWWDAISKLEDKIQAPVTVNGIDDTRISSGKTCSKVAGNARGPIQSQVGSGHDDGVYVHNRIERGVIESARIQKGNDPKPITDAIPWHMFFANVVVADPNFDRKGALDDWIRIYHDTNGKNTYYYRQNLGGGKFGPSTTFDVDMNCDAGPLYAFADFNNDGLDDFFCLKAGSAVAVSLNRGGNPPKFESIGQVVPTHDGFVAADVRIADIDGDGRADYCLTKINGDVICSRNGGQGDSYYWQGFSTAGGLRGVVFDMKKVDKSGITFGDINGDFRSDYLYIGDNGNVETWINMRGWGTGIVPEWKSSGVTHGGQSATGIRGNIKFGRIYGSGRLDYIYLKQEANYYDVRVWENTGGGGTKRKADGNFYCDMRGTGADDYVWIYQDGHAAEIFANIHQPPQWGHSTTITLSVPGPRVGIHLADWNGDGKCDVLVQNKATGALTLYENRYDAAKNTLTFFNAGVVTGAARCTEGWGVSIFDRGMRLADIDGDGRADVLCLQKNGRVTAWLNPKTGLTNVGQVKFSEGWDRSNMRFADVEGSGRADLIHLNKYTGAAIVFKNNGHTPGGGGSSFSWTNRGVLYSPIDRGETMHFTNQGGLGRADLLHVLPVTNRAWTYFNECGGGSGGDDGSIQNPGLPSYSSEPGAPGNGDGNGDGNGEVGEPGSSCNDIKGPPLNKGIWNSVKATESFQEWFRAWRPSSELGPGWLGDFARPLGLEQSITSCSISNACDRPNCNDLEDQALPETAWRYMTLVSAVNLNNYFSKLYDAADQAYQQFAGLEAAMATLFYPAPPDTVKGRSIVLSALAAALSVVFELGGEFVQGSSAVGALINGVIQIEILKMQNNDEILLGHTAQLETIAYAWINSTRDILDDINTNLIQQSGRFYDGSKQIASVDQLFAGGTFVDWRTLPVLGSNDQITMVADRFFQFLSIGLINWAWKAQYTYIACYPMPREIFDRVEVPAGNNDPRLKYYTSEGLGCYFQSAAPHGFSGTRVQNPPGWESFGSGTGGDLFRFSTRQVIQSSVSAFVAHGFDADVARSDEFLSKYAPGLREPESYEVPGLWNIPVCLPQPMFDDPDHWETDGPGQPARVGIDVFFSSLNRPDTIGNQQTWCFCRDTPDKNGRKFSDVFPALLDRNIRNCVFLEGEPCPFPPSEGPCIP